MTGCVMDGWMEEKGGGKRKTMNIERKKRLDSSNQKETIGVELNRTEPNRTNRDRDRDRKTTNRDKIKQTDNLLHFKIPK